MESKTPETKPSSQVRSESAPRRAYRKPVLKLEGTISHLTQGLPRAPRLTPRY